MNHHNHDNQIVLVGIGLNNIDNWAENCIVYRARDSNTESIIPADNRERSVEEYRFHSDLNKYHLDIGIIGELANYYDNQPVKYILQMQKSL